MEYLNRYQCPKCNEYWCDVWDCMVDDDCPRCGERHITPFRSDELDD